MRKHLVKGLAYTAAPKLTFATLNPKKAAFAKASAWALDRMTPHRRRHNRAAMAMKGFGAAAVAAPIGFWLGRHFLGGSDRHRPEHLA